MVFCDKLGHTRFISLFRSASHKRCANKPEDEPTNMSHRICTREFSAIHIHIKAVRAAARDSGFCSFSLTRCQLDLQGCANQGHQGGGEMHCVVICNWHVHLHQSLHNKLKDCLSMLDISHFKRLRNTRTTKICFH